MSAKIIVDEWVGSFIMVVGASILFCFCCMTFELVSTANKSDNWYRDSTFLCVSGKGLKSFNFGFLNCWSVTKILCRGEWLLEINIIQMENNFEVVLQTIYATFFKKMLIMRGCD